MERKTALVLGGTGIIGTPIVAQLAMAGRYEVHSISLEASDEPALAASIHQHVVDRNSDAYAGVLQRLTQAVGHWDVVIDLVAFDDESASKTLASLRGAARHVIVLSTTLVYDRSVPRDAPIPESCPLARPGEFGGYVDGKLELEKFWQSCRDTPWTLLRPYHVLGRRSLLGCLPEHNRDPELLERLMNGRTLQLCDSGEVAMTYVHPDDIALAIDKVAGNTRTFRQAYNLVHPAAFLAIDYYSEVARQLGTRLNVENVPMRRVWTEMKGWEMTTLPHVYDMAKLWRDTGYVPDTALSTAIADALWFTAPPETELTRIPVHQRMNKLPRPKRMEWVIDGARRQSVELMKTRTAQSLPQPSPSREP